MRGPCANAQYGAICPFVVSASASSARASRVNCSSAAVAAASGSTASASVRSDFQSTAFTSPCAVAKSASAPVRSSAKILTVARSKCAYNRETGSASSIAARAMCVNAGTNSLLSAYDHPMVRNTWKCMGSSPAVHCKRFSSRSSRASAPRCASSRNSSATMCTHSAIRNVSFGASASSRSSARSVNFSCVFICPPAAASSP